MGQFLHHLAGAGEARGSHLGPPSSRLSPKALRSPAVSHFVGFSCPVKIGGNSCAFLTQDLFQVVSGPRLVSRRTLFCYFSNS